MRRSHGNKRKILPGKGEGLDKVAVKTYTGEGFRAALLAAGARLDKAKEFRAQHGPVRILVKDGKPVEGTESA